MSRDVFFEEVKTVYWPSEFEDIVNMFKGLDITGKKTHPPLYEFNTGAIVLAAAIGYIKKRERDVGSVRQEITTKTFESQKFGGVPLTNYIALIAVLHERNVELLREGNESELIKIFERYAAGGLDYLRAAIARSADSTGYQVLFKEIQEIIGSDIDLEGQGLVDIFG
jgi:hypothetical protein